MLDVAILGQVAFGYSPYIDKNRSVSATRLTVFPLRPDMAPDAAQLLEAIAGVWPADGAKVSLNVASESLLQELMQAQPAGNVMVEIPAFMACDAANTAAIVALHGHGNTLLLKGRPLAELPRDDPAGAARGLIELLDTYNRAGFAHRHDLGFLDSVRADVESVLPALQATLNGAGLPLNRAVRHQVHLIEKLLKALATAYSRVVLGPAPLLGLLHRSQLHPALVHALDLLSRRLQLSYRFYARQPRRVWRTMHALYRRASYWQLEQQAIGEASALSIYRSALLTDFAIPAQLDTGELQRVREYIARFGDAAALGSVRRIERAVDVFVIDGRADRAGVALAKRPDALPRQGAWVLATRRLGERAEDHLRQLETGASTMKVGLPYHPNPSQYRDLLQRLAANWRGQRRQRAARMRFRPRAELRVGFPMTWQLLDPATADRRQPNGMSAANEWTVLNESPDGFALRHVTGSMTSLNVGEIVGVRLRERAAPFVCIARWIQSDSPDRLEIGLQQVAPKLVPVTFIGDPSHRTTTQPVLFAPTSPDFNRVPVIVAPARLIRPERDFQIHYVGSKIGLHAVRALESTPYVDVLQVRPI